MVATHVRRPRKSQSEIAARKKEKALERAGTAALKGDAKKAKKLAEKAGKPKKTTPQQAVQILGEAHALEMQITSLDLKIDGLKEAYKEAKAQRDVLLNRLRGEVRDMGQGRLPFGSDSAVAPIASETKAAKDETNPSKEETAAPQTETVPDEIEAEMAASGATS